jgi:hypothetical protein
MGLASPRVFLLSITSLQFAISLECFNAYCNNCNLGIGILDILGLSIAYIWELLTPQCFEDLDLWAFKNQH